MHNCRMSSSSTSRPVTSRPGESGAWAQYTPELLVQRSFTASVGAIPKTWKWGRNLRAWLSSLRCREKSRMNLMLSLEPALIQRSIVTNAFVGMSHASSTITLLPGILAASISGFPSFTETRIEGMSTSRPVPSSVTMVRRTSFSESADFSASTMTTACAPLALWATFTFWRKEQPPRLTMTMWMRRCTLPSAVETSSGGGRV
mmetsp:Transcript_37995/g.100510  ORF Transcript_37995/g.100510 Transcript_37995/m.100510 type:complete len:203 (+) Transcript_37995:637-1245(+)